MKQETPPMTAEENLIGYIYDFAWNYGRLYHIGDADKIIKAVSEKIELPEEVVSQFASTPTSKQEGEARRELHSITEDEVVELLTLVELIEDVSKNTPDDIEWVKENSYWSKSPLVGEKYLFHKHIDALGEQNIYFTRSWEQKGMEDTDAGIWPYHISIGEVRGPYGDCYKIIPVVEWFVSKGFKVGNLSLSATQQEGRREEAVSEALEKLIEGVQHLFDQKKVKGSTNVMKDAWNLLAGRLWDANKALAASIPPNKGKEAQPLTAERLKRFGFEKDKRGKEGDFDGVEIVYFKNGIDIYDHTEQGGGFVYATYTRYPGRGFKAGFTIKTVEQLIAFYEALTGESLTEG